MITAVRIPISDAVEFFQNPIWSGSGSEVKNPVGSWSGNRIMFNTARQASKQLEGGVEWLVDRRALGEAYRYVVRRIRCHAWLKYKKSEEACDKWHYRCVDLPNHNTLFLVSLKSKMQRARIFASSNVEGLRNHSVTFSVSKTDFACRLWQIRPQYYPCW